MQNSFLAPFNLSSLQTVWRNNTNNIVHSVHAFILYCSSIWLRDLPLNSVMLFKCVSLYFVTAKLCSTDIFSQLIGFCRDPVWSK